MPFNIFNQRHFTEAEKTDIRNHFDALVALLASKCANLTPEERKRFGSVNERNKLVVNKVREYYLEYPEKASPDVDWDEFMDNHDSRVFLEALINGFQEFTDGLICAKILHDYDNFTDALTDYGYTKYKVRTNSVLYRNKVIELSQFFTRTRSSEGESKEDIAA